MVHEHADKETTILSEENAKQERADPKLNSSEQMFGLPDEQEDRQGIGIGWEPGEKPVELIYRLNNSAELSAQEVGDPVQNLAGDSMESTQEPKESFEPESEDHIDQILNELNPKFGHLIQYRKICKKSKRSLSW